MENLFSYTFLAYFLRAKGRLGDSSEKEHTGTHWGRGFTVGVFLGERTQKKGGKKSKWDDSHFDVRKNLL